MNLREYPDRDLMMMDVADQLASELRSCLARHEAASFAVPGGTTPGPAYDTLSGLSLDWSRVTVLLTDERWVAPDSPRSNARLVRKRLLVDRAAEATFLPCTAADGDVGTPEAAEEALAGALPPHLPLSVLLIGMGGDGHIASLFPGSAEALATDAPPAMALTSPLAQEPRVTLTAPVLRGAMSTHLLITGPEKRTALDRAARAKDPLQVPAALILPHATIHWAP